MQIRFDRGTILIEAVQSNFEVEKLPGVVWDARVRSWRAPAEAYPLITQELQRAEMSSHGNVPSSMIAVQTWTSPQLRWYQQEALCAWSAASRRGVIALPTGSGKTILAMAAIASCAVAAIVLVPTRVLLEQWVAAMRPLFGDVGKLGDGTRDIKAVTVATYASAVLWAPAIGHRFGLVIVDEAHHVGAGCPSEVLEMMIAPARLGLTATPAIGDPAQTIDRHIGSVVYAMSIDDLVGDALADFDLMTVPIRLTDDERRRYDCARAIFNAAYSAFQRAAPDSPWNAFVAAATRSEQGRRALAGWRTSKQLLAYPDDKRRVLHKLLARHAEQRSLVFTQDTATAYQIARESLVQPITHEIGRKEREIALARFNAGEINVLVSAQVLDEGLDVPAAEIAIIVGGSSSSRRHVQRIGRVLRPAPNKRARIYELTVSDSAEVETSRLRRRAIGGAA